MTGAELAELEVYDGLVSKVNVGDFVIAGPVDAVWRVYDRIEGPKVKLLLQPVDPHDVPLSAPVKRVPVRRVPA